MKIRFTTKKANTGEHQSKKRNRFILRLKAKSQKIRRQELRNLPLPPSPLTSENSGKSLDLNKSGDKRGVHMRHVPKEELSDRNRRMRAMRKFYNKQMPVPQCNGCAYSGTCPQFKAGMECAFLPYLNAHRIETLDDIRVALRNLLEANMRRAHWGTITETLAGGAPSLENSEALSMLAGQLEKLYNLEKKSDTEVEIEVDGGIIGSLFGNLSELLSDTKLARAKPITVIPSARESERLQLEDSERREARTADVDVELQQDFERSQLGNRTRSKEPETILVSDVS